MGIPVYFSHIIKNHPKTLKKHCPPNSLLLMDCNSIVYDVVHSLPLEEQTEKNIIQGVIDKINHYITTISPTDFVYIAFDGVAPMAKMKQQKTRRYKTAFLETLPFSKKTTSPGFQTLYITPGTSFMKNLSERIHCVFSLEPKIIISTSQDSGEGEHKLFHYLRENPTLYNVVVYGLDADLIMLSLFHLSYSGNIFVAREKPHFANAIANAGDVTGTTDEKTLFFLDIQFLSKQILYQMKCVDNSSERIYDYVFLCFFLGNDFLPAFPSLNIRSHGMERLLDTYREYLGKYPSRRFLTNDGIILWKWIHCFVNALAKNEKEFLLQEYEIRNKWEKQTRQQLANETSHEAWLNATPILFREKEHYICPYDPHWEQRYYSVLFGTTATATLSKNYLEGLEWVYFYYTKGCVDTQWKYEFDYPPLLCDLAENIPTKQGKFSFFTSKSKKKEQYHTSKEQLNYIIPPQYLPLFGCKPDSHQHQPPKFTWAFKRYFWESHLMIK